MKAQPLLCCTKNSKQIQTLGLQKQYVCPATCLAALHWADILVVLFTSFTDPSSTIEILWKKVKTWRAYAHWLIAFSIVSKKSWVVRISLLISASASIFLDLNTVGFSYSSESRLCDKKYAHRKHRFLKWPTKMQRLYWATKKFLK